VQLLDLALEQAGKTATDPEHGMAAIQTESHSGACVHARSQSTDMEHRDPVRVLRRHDAGHRFGHRFKNVEQSGEATATQFHGLVVSVLGNQLRYRTGLLDALHQRYPPDPVVAHADQLWLATPINCGSLSGVADSNSSTAV